MPQRLGQHFLQDRTVLARIVSALDLEANDEVLEIGPGAGVLTRALADAAGSVTAVELDHELAERLGRSLDAQKIRIIEGNILEIDPCELMPGGYKLAGNIPYYISGAIVRKFLSTPCRPTVAVLMVQLEVARRMLAQPGEMSLLALSTQLYSTPSLVTRVRPGAFQPPPKVESAVVKLEVLPSPRVSVPSEAQFFAVARAGFGTKRKQLTNALAQGLGASKSDAAAILDTAQIDGTKRAEELSLDDWSRLSWAAHSSAIATATG